MDFVVYPEPFRRAYLLVTVFHTLALAVPIAGVVSIAMRQNYALSCKLQQMVERDPLTRVASRDHFFSALERDADRAGVMLMVDIDHFKRINDRFGHLVGDIVIKSVAGTLNRECRQADIVCRFGGEEFVIFLLRATADEGAEIADRIRRTIEADCIWAEGQTIRVTVSVGGAVLPAGQVAEDAIRVADAALYRAKATGRNRSVMAWDRSDLDGCAEPGIAPTAAE